MSTHTVSPSSSQGLGISYSSPPGGSRPSHPLSQSHVLPTYPQPYHLHSRQQPQQLPQQNSSYPQPSFQHYGPQQHVQQVPPDVPGPSRRFEMRIARQQSQSASNLSTQAESPPSPQRSSDRHGDFALKPTHKRSGGPKGFSSFSAITPTPAGRPFGGYYDQHDQQYQHINPYPDVGDRPDPERPAEWSARRLPLPPGAKDSPPSVVTPAFEQPSPQTPQAPQEPPRPESAASCSNSIATLKSMSSKSASIMRRFSKNGEGSGGRYQELSGYDDLKPLVTDEEPHEDGVMDDLYAPEEPASPVVAIASPVEMTPKPQSRPLPRQPSSSSIHHTSPVRDVADNYVPPAEQSTPRGPGRSPRRVASRSSTTSSSAATASLSQACLPDGDSSPTSDVFHPDSFPQPPSHPRRSLTTLSDPAHAALSRQISTPASHPMPRSMSQPIGLRSVAESNLEHRISAPPTDNDQEARRTSRVSSGIHSKNAILLSAEKGGMMLAFSPSGDRTWKEGEQICGSKAGLIPTPDTIHTPYQAPTQQPTANSHRPDYSRGENDDELRSRPWSESTMSAHAAPVPSPPFVRAHGRSHSDGAAILARQGTLFHPAGGNKRASQELGVMLGGRSRRPSANQLLAPPELDAWKQAGGGTDKVRLEASKKRKARIEVDVVLERECVVEGGEVRGRMEVRVTGGKRSEGLRVGGGKIRVVGFEEISSSSRHIFYHQSHPLPLFDQNPGRDIQRSSLFADPPDAEGYHLAKEGSHSIPFRMRLPLNGGAKGSYTSPNGKTPSVRYVVVGSIKIHVPSSGKRSIAHFYRQIVVLPYLNPAILLAPSPEPIEAKIERGLGWNLTGDKGRVELRVGLGRRAWVSGQRIWCEVAINNQSTRKIKSLHLALLQTVQTFTPQPGLDTSDKWVKIASNAHAEGTGALDADACQTSTSRRKVNEEGMEADFAEKGAGRVTGKGWWSGVEPGESGHWDMSVLAPPGMLSIRRTRLIEVLYNLRVTVNGSIYVDVPVTLINFLSIDPPPMPRDGPRLLAESGMVRAPIQHERCDQGGHAADLSHMTSMETMKSLNPARASSTTLHLDALLVAGRARAEAEGRGTESAKVRPTSMMSEYTAEPLSNSVEPTPKIRMGPTRFKSFLSARSDETGVTADTGGLSSEGHEEEGEQEEQDKQLVAARRARGRQRSLAAINRAMQRAKDEEDEEVKLAEAAQLAQSEVEEIIMSPMEEEYKPLETPAEISMPIVASPGVPPTDTVDDTLTPTLGSQHTDGIERQQEHDHVESEDEQEPVEHLLEDLAVVDAAEDAEAEVGDQTVLDELVSHHSEHGGYAESHLFGEYGAYDYAEEYEDQEDNETTPVKLRPSRPAYGHEVSPSRRKSLPRQLPQLNINSRLSMGGLETFSDHEANAEATQTLDDSLGVSAKSENGSEAGQVVQAVKRNVSVRVPPRLLALPRNEAPLDADGAAASPSRESDANVSPARTASSHGESGMDGDASAHRDTDALDLPPAEKTGDALPSPRGGSMTRRDSGFGGHGHGMRRELSNPPVASPLRSAIDLDYSVKSASEDDLTTGLRKQPSFPRAAPVSPLGMRSAASPRSPAGPGTGSLRAASGQKQLPSLPSPKGEATAQSPSTIASGLRHAVWLSAASPTPSEDADRDPPGLAPSVASDSASSDGHLESPPIISPPTNHATALPTKGPSSFAYSGLKYAAVSHDWAHGAHHLSTEASYLQTDPHPTIHRRGSNRLGPVTSRASSDDNHSVSTHETSASILPSVRTKIAQLESRDEALRKFSIASITGSQPPPVASPKYAPSSPKYTPSSPAKSPSGRKSYTAALAPRPPRSAPVEYILNDRLGGTTYVRPRVYRETKVDLDGPLDPFGLGLKRDASSSSTSSSATGLEAAPGNNMAPRSHGSHLGGTHMSPRTRDLPPVPRAARVAEETDDSEGLL